MAGELQDIVDNIVLILKNDLTPPGDQKLADAFDEPPILISRYPVFVILEEEIPDVDESLGGNEDFLMWAIGLHLITGAYDTVHAVRDRRPWIKPVLEIFNTKSTLNGQVDGTFVNTPTFEPFEWGDNEFVQAHFVLNVFGVS